MELAKVSLVVTSFLKSTMKKHLAHGKVSELTFDPNKWVWENDNYLLDFIVVKRKKMFEHLNETKEEFNTKMVLDDDLLKLRWKDVWLEALMKKYSCFILTIRLQTTRVNCMACQNQQGSRWCYQLPCKSIISW
jgi:hypothetical protein